MLSNSVFCYILFVVGILRNVKKLKCDNKLYMTFSVADEVRDYLIK